MLFQCFQMLNEIVRNTEMKESKDLLDLGIIVEANYETLKEELTPIIIQT